MQSPKPGEIWARVKDGVVTIQTGQFSEERHEDAETAIRSLEKEIGQLVKRKSIGSGKPRRTVLTEWRDVSY